MNDKTVELSPELTDQELLAATFTKLGIPFTTDKPELIGPGIPHAIEIDEGQGYNGFVANFYFDSAGKCTGHGCWE